MDNSVALAADSSRSVGGGLAPPFYRLGGSSPGCIDTVPDTDENREAFGLPPSSRSQAAYPQVRLVALMALRSHLISGAAFGPYSGKKTGEHSLAQQLWPQLPEQSLVILDKSFIDYGLFYRLSHATADTITGLKHWLVRAKKNLRWKTPSV